jgi:hypothetical protein
MAVRLSGHAANNLSVGKESIRSGSRGLARQYAVFDERPGADRLHGRYADHSGGLRLKPDTAAHDEKADRPRNAPTHRPDLEAERHWLR